MRFTRLRLENWRNFAEVEVQLGKRVFMVGPNASGKSNLLDALRFLRDLVVTGGGLQAAIAQRGGITRIRNLAARQAPDLIFDVELLIHDQAWRYRLAFGTEGRSPQPLISQEQVWQGDTLILNRPQAEDNTDPARVQQTFLEQTLANQAFRPIAEFFRSIHYSHLVPQVIRTSNRDPLPNDPYGSDLLEQIGSKDSRSRDPRLTRILKAIQVAVPQFSELGWERDVRGIPHLRINYAHWRAKGAWQNEQDLSDGTLRLIGLLWALQEGDGPLLLEEPELSLHPAIVRHIPAMMQRVLRLRKDVIRQLFISTHSPDLLIDKGIGLDEVLLLIPQAEGSQVSLGTDIPKLKIFLQSGLDLPEILTTHTAPPNPQQLALL